MDEANVGYWQATDQILALARDIVVKGTPPPPPPYALIEPLLDLDTGFLIRVATNLAAAEFKHIAEHLGFNQLDYRMIQVVLEPLRGYDVVQVAQSVPADTVQGVYAALRSEPTLDDAVVPPYIAGSAAPTANVLNGAMPVISAFLWKCTVLESEAQNVPEQLSKVDDAIGRVKSRLGSWLRI